MAAVPEAEYREAGDASEIGPLSPGHRRDLRSREIEPPGLWAGGGAAAAAAASLPESHARVAAWTGRPAPAGAPSSARGNGRGCVGRPDAIRPVAPVGRWAFRVTLGRLGTGLSLAGKPMDGATGPAAGTRGVPVIGPDIFFFFLRFLFIYLFI